MRKVVFHVQSRTQQRAPPPPANQVNHPWTDLPQANRQQLLWLLSLLLERQLQPGRTTPKEDGDERTARTE